MKQSIALKWIAALRGIDYVQAKSSPYLRPSLTVFSPLGVLVDLYIAEHLTAEDWEWDNAWGVYAFKGEMTTLPTAVQVWADIGNQFADVNRAESISQENKNGASFYEISCIIEDNWRDL